MRSQEAAPCHGPVAQWTRALVFGTRCWEFESLQDCHFCLRRFLGKPTACRAVTGGFDPHRRRQYYCITHGAKAVTGFSGSHNIQMVVQKIVSTTQVCCRRSRHQLYGELHVVDSAGSLRHGQVNLHQFLRD